MIQGHHGPLASHCDQYFHDYISTALQNEYHSSSGQSENSGELEKLLNQEEKLKKEYSAVQEKQEEFSSTCKSMEKQKAELVLENEKLSEEKERRENETTVVLPLRRFVLICFF